MFLRSAVAPDTRVYFSVKPLPGLSKVDSSIRRIHHPSGAAPLGTPVRARFCIGVFFAEGSLLLLAGTSEVLRCMFRHAEAGRNELGCVRGAQ